MFAYISTYHVLKWWYLILSPTFPHLNINFSLLFKVPKSTIFNRSRWHHDEARLQTLVYMCIKSKSPAQFLHTKLACKMYLTSGENVKTDNFQSVPESTIFNRSRWNLDEARLQTSVYTCIKFKSSSSTPSYPTRVHNVLNIGWTC